MSHTQRVTRARRTAPPPDPAAAGPSSATIGQHPSGSQRPSQHPSQHPSGSEDLSDMDIEKAVAEDYRDEVCMVCMMVCMGCIWGVCMMYERMFMGCMSVYGVYMWCVYVVCIYGVCIWCVYMMCVYGVYLSVFSSVPIHTHTQQPM